jgi:CHASE2 domain-containing sensor protein
MTRRRPFGVTLVAVIAWLSGAIQIVDAVIDLLGGTKGRGWIALAIGILTIAVSLGLFRGRNVARVIMAVVFVLNIAVGAWALFVSPYIWIPFFTFLLALIGLVLLFTRRANDFFR